MKRRNILTILLILCMCIANANALTWVNADQINASEINAQKLYVNSGLTNTNTVFESTDSVVGIAFKDSNTVTEPLIQGVGDDIAITLNGNTNFYGDASTGFYGIGTFNPTEKLHVESAGNTFNRITTTGTGNYKSGLYMGRSTVGWELAYNRSNEDLQLQFNNNGVLSDAMYWDYAGKVGIGTSTPSANLDVNGKDNSNAVQISNGETQSQSFGLKVTAGTNANDYPILIRNSGNSVDFFRVRGDGLAYFNGGNVGVGTASPEATLHVNSINGFNSTSQTAPFIIAGGIGSTGSHIGGIGFASKDSPNLRAGISGVVSGSDGDQRGIAFFTHPTTPGSDPMQEVMRLDHLGRLGIGTATPGAKLTIDNSGTDKSFILSSTNENTFSGDIDLDFDNPYYAIRATLDGATNSGYSGFMFERVTTPQVANGQLFKVLSTTADTSGYLAVFDNNNADSESTTVRVETAGDGMSLVLDSEATTKKTIYGESIGEVDFPYYFRNSGNLSSSRSVGYFSNKHTTSAAPTLWSDHDSANGVSLKITGGACATGDYGLYEVAGDLFYCKNGVSTQLN